jgi:hypothetical protein
MVIGDIAASPRRGVQPPTVNRIKRRDVKDVAIKLLPPIAPHSHHHHHDPVPTTKLPIVMGMKKPTADIKESNYQTFPDGGYEFS